MTTTSEATLKSWLGAVQERLRVPDGRPLKVFLSGDAPRRAVVAIYSMILNGYRPSSVFVFGEHAWKKDVRETLYSLLPFATIVPTQAVMNELARSGDSRVCESAFRHGPVLKMCAAVLYPPVEFCLMDENVFVLDRPEEGLRGFQRANLVYAPHERDDANIARWSEALGRKGPLRTSRLGAGLYWLRNTDNLRLLTANLLRVPFEEHLGTHWEEGFLAAQFSNESVRELSPDRYVQATTFDSPEGVSGYDYSGNPRKVVTIDFRTLEDKPSEVQTESLAAGLLGRASSRPDLDLVRSRP